MNNQNIQSSLVYKCKNQTRKCSVCWVLNTLHVVMIPEHIKPLFEISLSFKLRETQLNLTVTGYYNRKNPGKKKRELK